jgi:hypothetical protein
MGLPAGRHSEKDTAKAGAAARHQTVIFHRTPTLDGLLCLCPILCTLDGFYLVAKARRGKRSKASSAGDGARTIAGWASQRRKSLNGSGQPGAIDGARVYSHSEQPPRTSLNVHIFA